MEVSPLWLWHPQTRNFSECARGSLKLEETWTSAQMMDRARLRKPLEEITKKLPNCFSNEVPECSITETSSTGRTRHFSRQYKVDAIGRSKCFVIMVEIWMSNLRLAPVLSFFPLKGVMMKPANTLAWELKILTKRIRYLEWPYLSFTSWKRSSSLLNSYSWEVLTLISKAQNLRVLLRYILLWKVSFHRKL